MVTKTKGRIIAAVLLVRVTSFAQDAPHLISRPAVVAPNRPDVPPCQPHQRLRRALIVGSRALAAEATETRVASPLGPPSRVTWEPLHSRQPL